MGTTLNRDLKQHFKKHGRHDLPWRKTRDPYAILVSEIMLQQTQVERVIPFYERFLQTFPTASMLSKAPLGKALQLWQGLGYNRRAKLLREAAILISKKGFPKTVSEIEELPGVGPYTARAVSTFAYNTPEIFIETNIRTVFLHYYFQDKDTVSDAQIFPLIEKSLRTSRMQPRDYYWTLMDLGSHLKRSGVRNNARSKHYVRQSKFQGSRRQLRGAILRELLKGSLTSKELVELCSRSLKEVEIELQRLCAEELIIKHKTGFTIAK